MQLRCVYLIQVAMQAQSDTAPGVASALQSLATDMALWRRVLHGDGMLLSKIVAQAWLKADYHLLAEIIADPKTLLPANAVVEALLPSDAQQDWNLDPALGPEYRQFEAWVGQVGTAKSVQADEGWRGRWQHVAALTSAYFLQPRATANLEAQAMGRIQGLLATPPGAYAAARKQFDDWYQQTIAGFTPRSVYNPMGRSLVAIGIPIYFNYPTRAHEIAADERLVLLAWQIRRQQIAVAAVPAFMHSHPELATHPVSGTAFEWLPERNQIAMRPLGQSELDRFTVPIWKP